MPGGRNNDSRYTAGEIIALVTTLVRVCATAIGEKVFPSWSLSENTPKPED